MGRSISDIVDMMKTEFVSSTIFQELYGLKANDNFDKYFSKVSVESAWIYLMSASIWLFEKLMDNFREEVDSLIDSKYVTSLSWYRERALDYQKGDELRFDTKTYSFGYAEKDEEKRVVRNVAVREVEDNGVTKLKIYFSDVNKQAITGDVRTAFESYMRKIGAAGTHFLFVSQAPDKLRIHMQVYYDPLVLDSSGMRLSGGGKPVEETMNTYLNSLEYAGTFYASKLIDMLQLTDGVKDVTLDATTWNGSKANRRKIDSLSGAFVLEIQNGDIVYSID